jgi:cation-transporting ATPase E
MPTTHGLTEADVQDRRRRGLINTPPPPTTRTLNDILRANIFTTINVIIVSIALVLIALGRVGDGILSGGLVVINSIVGIVQELRAKRQLDQIALINRPKAIVLRRRSDEAHDEEMQLDPAELVQDDVLILQPGEQAVLDGDVIEGRAEIDESLLTGESDLIAKHAGDPILSGSFCVNGRALYRATKVGKDSYANQLAGKARAFRAVKTPLQKEIDFTLRILMIIALVIGFFMFVSAIVNQLPLVSSVAAAAVIAGIVPNGLVLAVLVAYSLGAVRIAQRGALVQQTNAIESLSNVDVLCTDKTGTLTANQITFHSAIPLDLTSLHADARDGAHANLSGLEATLKQIAGDFAHSATSSNKTNDALKAALQGRALRVIDEVPFSSARKWSALAINESDVRGVLAMGAIEMLRDHLCAGCDLDATVQPLTDQGLRVLLLAHATNATSLHDAQGNIALPRNMQPLGLLAFADVLRADAKETIQKFRDAGIRIKVISGDDPNTVAALAKQAGFGPNIKLVSGLDLAKMPDAMFSQAAEEGVIFGRITPEQKEKLVDALRSRGHYVAMIGDGVNDVLSLKKAHLGIAMQSGSAATRGVADMVLLNDSFAALAPAFTEGQRIVNGMRDILNLFLTRCFYVALMILATGFVGVGFPFGPRNITLLTAMTVGLPTVMIAYWARPAPVRGGLLRSVWSFVMPAALSMLAFGLIVYVLAFSFVDRSMQFATVAPQDLIAFRQEVAGLYDLDLSRPENVAFQVANIFAQNAVTIFSLLAGLLLTVFVQPPFRFLAGGRPYSGDKRMMWLALGLFVIFLIGWNIPFLRFFFSVILLPDMTVLALILAATLAWAVVLLFLWRQRIYERFVLGRNVSPPK